MTLNLLAEFVMIKIMQQFESNEYCNKMKNQTILHKDEERKKTMLYSNNKFKRKYFKKQIYMKIIYLI